MQKYSYYRIQTVLNWIYGPKKLALKPCKFKLKYSLELKKKKKEMLVSFYEESLFLLLKSWMLMWSSSCLGIYNYIEKLAFVSVSRMFECITRIEKYILIFASLKSDRDRMWLYLLLSYLHTKMKIFLW